MSDGKVLWIYDIAGRQASKLIIDQGYLVGAALQFLLGDGKLVDAFEISALSCSDSKVELSLLPKAAASYERLGLDNANMVC